MSYSEEKTRAYNSMMYAWGVFEEMKKTLTKEKCSIHNKKLKIGASWEQEYDLDIAVYKYCCADFAKQIAIKLTETSLFASVTILKE